MPARSLLRLVHRALLLAGPLVYAGCAGAGPGNVATPPPRPGSLVTQEAIAASGAKTAWDALKRTVPYVHLRESRGRPARITRRGPARDRKSTRLNSSHGYISYAVFCLKKKKHNTGQTPP